MKKAMFFLAATVVALPVFADDLLDEVLRWDKPVMRPATRQVPDRVPASRAMPMTDEDGLEESTLQNSERRTRKAWSVLQTGEALNGEKVEEQKAGVKAEKGPEMVFHVNNSAAETERGARLACRAGIGDKTAGMGGELILPLGNTVFDLSCRGFFSIATVTLELGDADFDTDAINYALDALVLLRPLRGGVFSPYAGLGGRYEGYKGDYIGSMGTVRIGSMQSQMFGLKHESGQCFGLGWRVGITLNWDELRIESEYAAGEASNELIGTVGLQIARCLSGELFVERFQGKGPEEKSEDRIIVGGGLTFSF